MTVAPDSAEFNHFVDRIARNAVIARRREHLSFHQSHGNFRQFDSRAGNGVGDRHFGHFQEFALCENHRVAIIGAVE